MRTLVVGLGLALSVSGEPLMAQSRAPSGNPGATVRVSELNRYPRDTGVAARARLALRSTTSRAALRIRTIEISPKRLELTAGDEVALHERLSLVARDSAGRIVRGWAPTYTLVKDGDAAVASLELEHLFGALPGTFTVQVEPNVFNDSSAWGVARPRVVATVPVVVRQAVYVRPERAPATPVEVARAFVAAIVAEEWTDAATYVDLVDFQSWVIERLGTRRYPTPKLVTLEQFAANMARSGGESMPRAEIERRYEALRRARLPETLDASLMQEFSGISPDTMAALPTAEAAARWLAGRDGRVLIRKAAIEMGCDSARTRTLVAGNMVKLQVLGAANTNESTAWVMVAVGPSLQWQASSERPPALLLLQRDASGQWRVNARNVFSWSSSLHYNANCARAPR